MKRIILGIYIITLLFFSVFSYFFVDQHLIYLNFLYTGFSSIYRYHTSVVYLILLLVLHILYFSFIRLYSRKIIRHKEIIILISITIVLLFLSYPSLLSYDIYNYIATAKISFFYRENPYVIMPIELANDPVLSFMHAANKTALYGPVWIGLTGVPHSLGFGNFLLTMFGFKLFVVFFYVLSNILIYKLVRNWYAVMIFALNPLVVVETLISSHNDIVMIGLALISYYLLKRKQILLAALFLLLSIGIKFATIFLIPVFLYVSILIIKNKVIDWSKIYNLSCAAMFCVFILSPFREEMYPWYAIWFFVFICLLIPKKSVLVYSSLFLFGLMLRYIPFIVSGTYDSTTIQLRTAIMYLPLLIYVCLVLLNKFFTIKHNPVMVKKSKYE